MRAKPPIPISLTISYFYSGSSVKNTTCRSSSSRNSYLVGSASSICIIIFLCILSCPSIILRAVFTTSSGFFSSSSYEKSCSCLAIYYGSCPSPPFSPLYLTVNLVFLPLPEQQVISTKPSLFFEWISKESFEFEEPCLPPPTISSQSLMSTSLADSLRVRPRD